MSRVHRCWLLLGIWFGVVFPLSAAVPLDLTFDEREWLQSHPILRTAGASLPPFGWLDGQGRAQGIGADYARLIAERLGVQVVPAPTQSAAASFEQLRRRECDIAPMIVRTPEREEILEFTEELMVLPVVVITRADNAAVKNLTDLRGKRVAVPRGWPIQEQLINDHPQLQLVPLDDVGSALLSVALGDTEAFIGDLASATYQLERLGVTNLKIAAQTPYSFPFCIGVRWDWPELVGILNKVISTITPEEHAAIQRRWVAVRDDGLPLRRILYFAVPILGVVAISFLMLSNRRLGREIQRRQATEAQLKASEERWSFALEGSRDGVWDWNVKTNEVFFSPQWKALLGYDGEFGNRFEDWTVRIHPDDRSAVIDHIQEHLRGGQPFYEIEHRIIGPDGAYRWVLGRGRIVSRDEAGQPLRMVGTLSDISARKRAESDLIRHREHLEDTVRARTTELREQQEKLSSVLHATPESVLLLDCHGKVLAANEIAAQRFGRTLQEIVGSDYRSLMDRETSELRWQAVAEAMATRKLIIYEDERDDRRYQSFYNPIVNAQGESSGVAVLGIDITERTQMTTALEQARDSAEAASRSKSVFLASMSHEIRTPMNAILGFAQLLQRDAGLSETQRHHLDTIQRSGEHLLALINDILEMSKIEAGRTTVQLEVFDLRTLLADLETMFRVRTEARRLQLEFALASGVPRYIRSDEGKLRQILINLIGNAVKFTERGGIGVRIHAVRGLPTQLTIEVQDTGPGIAEEECGRLFHHFEQASAGRRVKGGTGLGLVISREFARLLGGDITVQSHPGEGSTFRVELKVEEATAPRAKAPRGERVIGLEAGQPPCRVLVADDRFENRELLFQMLRYAGFEVRQVSNGEEVITTVEEWHPHLILMDLHMPLMDGFEAIRQLRARPDGSAVRIIAVTASVFEEDRRRVVESGADDFLAKPFRDEELWEKIRQATGVSYRYAPDLPAPDFADLRPTSVDPTPRPSGEKIALPAELRARLREAAVLADVDAVHALLSEAEAEHPAAVQELRALADAFDYPQLLAKL